MGGRKGIRQIAKAQIGKRNRGVGVQTFEEVEQLTANGAMKRVAAFKHVAERIGSSPGTVAANYYRIARQRGVPLRARRSTGGPALGRASAKTLTNAIQAIQAALRSQEAELATLRKDNQRFAKLRRLLRA